MLSFAVALGLVPAAPAQQADTKDSVPALVATLQRASLPELAARLRPADSAWVRVFFDSAIVRQGLTDKMAWNKRAMSADLIARFDPDAVPFTLALLLQEPDTALVQVVVRNMASAPHFKNDQRVTAVLQYLVGTHRSVGVAVGAVETLRSLAMRSLRDVVTERLKRTPATGDTARRGLLLAAEDRAVNLDRGLMLPTFMRRAPAPFVKRVARPASIRVLAFGDFGFKKSPNQRATADAMQRYHRQHPFDFGITLGDNFYGEGLSSPDDPRWKNEYEALYGRLGVEIFASFGNHDEYDPDSPPAEILYAGKSKTWRFPAQYYTYTAGPVQFFVIDANDPSVLQQEWLRESLDKSTAAWKVVYGHFPLYLAAGGGEYRALSELLMPILKGRADVYLAGHHHSMQHVKPVDGVNFFIIGSGGATSYQVDDNSPRKLFAKSEYGFGVVEATPRTFTVRFIDKASTELYSYTLRK